MLDVSRLPPMKIIYPSIIAFTTFLQAAFGAQAVIDWTTDNTSDGQGTGILIDSSNNAVLSTVTFSSGDGALNGGVTFAGAWSTYTGTNGAPGVINSDSIAIDTFAGGLVNSGTVTFGTTLYNPIVLVAFLDLNDVFTFTNVDRANIVLLDSHNAALHPTNPLITGTGGTDNANDGFAVQLMGSYNSIGFSLSHPTATQSVAFTIQGDAATIPEPSAWLLSMVGLSGLLMRRSVRRN